MQYAYRVFTRSIRNRASASSSGYSFTSCSPLSDTADRKEMWCYLVMGWRTVT